MGRAENQELKRAILAYDLAAAERALRAGASPEVLIGERRTRSPLLASSETGTFAPDAFRGLHLAAYDDDAELAALLLLHGANPHAEIYPRVLPISIAAQHNHLRAAEVLLYEYVRPTGNFGYCPLSMAARGGHLQMVELLLDRRRDQMNVDGALHSAVSKKDNLAITERLLAEGANAGYLLPGAGDPPSTIRMQALRFLPEALPLFAGHAQHRLIDAAIDGDAESLARFLDEGAPPDDADVYGYITALTAASRCGHLEIVERLIERGATLQGPKGKADPLMSALRGGHTDIAERLWSLGARARDMVACTVLYGLPFESVVWAVDRTSCEPGSVLYTALRVSRMEVVRFALARGADPSHDRFRRSALMLAASRRKIEIVELLIERGADVHAVDDDGHSALHYAVALNDMDDPEDPFEYDEEDLLTPVAQLLQRHGLALS